ncbi:MAG: hypothetical protein MMC23_005857 [Stictis urceolatum]|nr:hypothetical protein [Stictis urceolata]
MAFAADPPHVHGTLTKYFLASADFCYKIPDSLSLKEAALIEPLAVGVHAVRSADIKPGHKVIVFGAGTVGLLCAAVAKEFGASVVVSVDLLQSKLDVARQFIGTNIGKTATADPAMTPEANAGQLLAIHGLGDGADAVIDASGAASSVQTGAYSLRPGGTYVQVGMGKRWIEFPIAELCERELNFKGCYRYGPGDFELALTISERGNINLPSLIARVFSFEEAAEAWKATERGQGIKNLIEGPKDD